jgi:hypothetical protein
MKRYTQSEFVDQIRKLALVPPLDLAIGLHLQAPVKVRLFSTEERLRAFLALPDKVRDDDERRLLLVQPAIVCYRNPKERQYALAYLKLLEDSLVPVTTPEPDPPGALVPISQGLPVSSAETKAERFRRLAEPRVSRALKAIALVGNLGDRSNYELTDAEAAAICRALRSELDQAASRLLTGRKPQRSFSFKL